MNVYQKLSDQYPIEIQQKYKLKIHKTNQALTAFDDKFKSSVENLEAYLEYYKLDMLETLYQFFECNPSIDYEIDIRLRYLLDIDPHLLRLDIHRQSDRTILETLYFWFP